MPPKNSGGSTKFPGARKVIHRTAQTAFVELSPPVLCNKAKKTVNDDQTPKCSGIHCSIVTMIAGKSFISFYLRKSKI